MPRGETHVRERRGDDHGYIGQNRVAEAAQGHWLVQRGARMVRDLSSPGLIYLGVIARENPRARRLLVEHRPPAGLRAERLCGLTSCAILLRGRRLPRTSGFEVRPAANGELSRIQAFLHDQGPRRQFFPAYTLEDLAGGPHLRGLGPADLMVAWRDDSVCGVLGAWDQAAYKQDIVESYGAGLARARPLYDVAARVLRARPLTRPGHAIPIAFGVCSCVADDDPDVMRALVARCAHHAVRRGKAYLMLGMCDGDPLLDVVRRWPHIAYHSDVYALSFSINPGDVLDDRTPHIEVGTL